MKNIYYKGQGSATSLNSPRPFGVRVRGKKALSLIIIMFCLMTGTASAGIDEYTAYPPFLPRVVSPNIMFMLDYSKSMVRPSYGTCYKYGSNANCGSVLTGDRVFNNMTDDYSSTTSYYGYYDNGYGRTDIAGCNVESTYADACAFKYACSANSTCSKNSNGSWNGNWLNWLTMTQFDVMKKVVIGGDTTPAPDNQNAASPTLESKLTSLGADGTSGIYKAITFGNYSGRAPSSLWSSTTPQTLPYSWIDTPGSGVTTVFGSPTDSADVNGVVRTTTLPFDFTFYGTTYSTGSNIYINENGWFSFTSIGTSYWTNEDMPSGNLPNNFIAPFWDDLQVVISKNSTIKTFTVGSAPNRIFVISFENIINAADGGKADPISFQALLFEGTSQIVFQYKEVKPTIAGWGAGRSATVGVENSNGTQAKKYSFNGSSLLSNNRALFMTPNSILYNVKPKAGSPTLFLPVTAGASDNDYYNVKINVTSKAKPAEGCKDGWFSNNTQSNKTLCYDHEITGLFQDLADGELAGTLAFRLGVMRVGYNGDDGGDIKTKGKEINATTTSSFFTATRNDGPTDRTPLGEAMYEAMRFFKQDAPQWPTTGVADYNYDDSGDLAACSTTGNEYDPYCYQSAGQKVECCKSFVLLLSSGNYSDDFGLNMYDATSTGETPNAPPVMGSIQGCKSTQDGTTTCTADDEGLKANGGWLDDVAYQSHVADLRDNTELAGTQNLTLYVVNTFGSGSGDGADILKKAAKFGGFDDRDTDSTYDATVSGICTPAKGEDDLNCDGKPDTYFEASGGGDLKTKIIAAVSAILKSSASGTTVSVLSTSASGEGAIYQAYFYPARVENQTEDRTWPGYLRGFYLDKYQNLRDDSDSSKPTIAATALVMEKDKIVRMRLDTASNTVKVDRFSDTDGDGDSDAAADPATTDMDNVVTIWESGKKLAERTKGTNPTTAQSSDRNIYSWVDRDNDGAGETGDDSFDGSGETLLFTTGNMATLKPYLRASDPDGAGPLTDDDEATNIIKFIRGNAVAGYRNRCISVTDGGGDETGCTNTNSDSQRSWALGDIIYSTPTLVSGPGEKFDEIYGDSAYRTFRNKYANRRSVIYVGANDGMLHAFNGGVYHIGDKSGGDVESGWFTANPHDDDGLDSDGISGDNDTNGWGSSDASPALGDELWTFIPHDNLPHLAWLACNSTTSDPSVCGDATYTHVYYVDQRPKVTDARIFSADEDHPGGWGTVLIMGMRLGGGAMDVTIDGTTRQFRSAFYAFDITNPEDPPKLLWRFYDSGLGFTASYPAIARICSNGSNPCTAPGVEKWYMVVGSGPKNITGATGRDYNNAAADQTGKLFVVDLADGILDKTFTLESNITTMGDPTVVDADINFTSDVVYIGSSKTVSSTSTSGKVYRIKTNGKIAGSDSSVTACPADTTSTADWCWSLLTDAGKPLLVSPSVSKDSLGNLWVFFGTGRLRSTGDLSNKERQRFFGIKDKCGKPGSTCTDTYTAAASCSTTATDLCNVSAVKITESTGASTQVKEESSNVCGDTKTECSFADLIAEMRKFAGWYVDIDPNYDATKPSERVLSRSVVLGGLLMFTAYKPTSEMCSIFGDSTLYALYYETGTAYIKPALPEEANIVAGEIEKSMSLGKGMPTAVGVAIGETVSGFVQKSTGEIVRVEAQPGLGVRSGAASWREKTGGGGTSEIETIYKHIVK